MEEGTREPGARSASSLRGEEAVSFVSFSALRRETDFESCFRNAATAEINHVQCS